MKGSLTLPVIAEEDKSPLVLELLAIIEGLNGNILELARLVQQLKDEIARIKGQPPRPNIRPSSLRDKKKAKAGKGKKRPGSKKRSKTVELKIHETVDVEPESLPVGSEFKSYKDFVVQDIIVETHNTRYRLKVYQKPDGDFIAGEPPAVLNGKHFGPTLVRFVLYQYYHCHVTQPLLLEQLHEMGIDISSGHLNNLLIENKDQYHLEKDRILSTGLEVASYINVDDTGARHKGQNGYCTHIGNSSFAWFESTDSKSRINFLELLRAGRTDFTINADAIAYMVSNKLPSKALEPILDNLNRTFFDPAQWTDFLTRNGIVTARHVQIATEGVLIGSIIEHGIAKDLVIVSDDAGQFNVLLHALCWIHANRAIDKIVPFTDPAKKDLAAVKDQIWDLYEGLKAYKINPNPEDKQRLEGQFDTIFRQTTSCDTLNAALKRQFKNKSELLMVLQRPDIPLHNNASENDIREYVKKRKISGGTRSELGRRCRDTFTSLKKTCRKLRVSFWQYLKDRIENLGVIPPLPDLIRQHALRPG